MSYETKSLLGKQHASPEFYSPDILFPIPRAETRSVYSAEEIALLRGEDVWQVFELSWLNSQGMPQQAMARLHFSASSPNIIESKSLKLYFNSLNNHRFETIEALKTSVATDLSTVAGSSVKIEIFSVSDNLLNSESLSSIAICLDELQLTEPSFEFNADLLQIKSEKNVEELVFTDLFRSSCPVTGQPDWASIIIKYQGDEICHVGLLAYLLSFRQHQEFHEQCVERIFLDVLRKLQPEKLLVQAKFLRRGGLDISPVRYFAYQAEDSLPLRLIRQ